MTAVHSYIAQRDAQLSQKLSEYSTVLAADSREIAAASKRDSTAMKGIAFLTMVFLPGTYIAIQDASSSDRPSLQCHYSTFPPHPTSGPGFWIYWAATGPLTIAVLAIYLTYLTRASRKSREEDQRARDNVAESKDMTASLPTEAAHYYPPPQALRSRARLSLSYYARRKKAYYSKLWFGL